MELPKFKPGSHAWLMETGFFEDLRLVIVVRESEPRWPFKVLVLDGRTPFNLFNLNELTFLSLDKAHTLKEQFLPIEYGLDSKAPFFFWRSCSLHWPRT